MATEGITSRSLGQGLLLLLVITVGELPVTLEGCSHFLDMMDEVEACNKNFTAYKVLVLRGELSYKNKATVCRQFQATSQCLERVIADCQLEDAVHMEHAETMLDDHVTGFGKLCNESSDFYEIYENHAACYSRFSAQTSSCMQTFTSTVDEWHRSQIEDDYVYEEDYGNPSICKSIETMYSCVQSVMTECGQEAADLYVQLCQFQVPRDLEDHCLDMKPYWSEKTSLALTLTGQGYLVLLSSVLVILTHNTRY